MKHAPRTMELGTMCKVVGVLVLLMVLIAGVFSTCFHVLRNRDKRRETFANPANPMTPSVQKVSADDLQFFETDARDSPADMYDATYAHLHYSLFDMPKRKVTEFECVDFKEIGRLAEYGSKAVLLDIGCGAGSHLKQFCRLAPRATLFGLDQSTDMLQLAESKLGPAASDVRFMRGDMEEPNIFHEKMFTHITCYSFTIYYSDNLRTFFENTHNWLKTGGHLCVHAVDPRLFNPVPLVANPIKGIPLQKYMNPRKTDARVYFQTFLYESDFEYDEAKNRASFHESIIYPKDEYVRTHTHHYNMPPYDTLIQIARKCGFKLRHITKMKEIGVDSEYLCYFQKR
jgi:ubiquinone/menaquinone biosynthesis C-methylase UbiE